MMLSAGQNRPYRDHNRPAAFEVDVGNKVHVTIDFDLAIRVGQFLLDHQMETNDRQILGLAHKLANLDFNDN